MTATERAWLAIPADDATVELVAEVLEAGAEARRRAALAISEELMAEKRERKDIRSGAVKLAEVMAQASTLERVAAQVRAGDLPEIEGDPAGARTFTARADGVPVVEWTYTDDPAPSTPAAQTVDLGDGRTAWVPDVDTVAAALGIDEGAGVPDVTDEEGTTPAVPFDPGPA